MECVFTNRYLLALPLHSSVVPRRRTNPKCSMLFVPHLVLSRTAKLHKFCIVRATSPKEEAISNTSLTDVQEAPQKRRKKEACLENVFSSAERCWSTYSFIHNVKRDRLNENRAESLVYVHYDLRLLSHYCDRAYEDPKYEIWDNHPEDDNLEDGTIYLEELEEELIRDEDETAAAAMPPPPFSGSA